MRMTKMWGLLMGLVLVCPVWAAPPVPQVCDQADSGERLKCKFDNVVQQQLGIVAVIDDMDILPADEELALSDEINRTGRAQGRTQAIEFKQLTKKSKVTCQVQEILGDGVGDDDGICRANEDCAELLNDQIGDDDGVCHPRNGNHREVCVEICDDDAINLDPSNFDDDPSVDSRGRDLEEMLDGLTVRYEGIGRMLEDEAVARAVAERASAGSGPCDAVIRRRPSSVLMAVLSGAAEGARAATDVAERFCDQTALGFNGSAACAVAEGIAGAARIVVNAFEVEDAAIDSTTLDTIFACVKETSTTALAAAGAVASVGGDLTALAAQVVVVDGRVQTSNDRLNLLDQELDQVRIQLANTQAVLNYAIELLLLPPGQRPGYNNSHNPTGSSRQSTTIQRN